MAKDNYQMLYQRLLRQLKPTYPYRLRLFLKNDLSSKLDDWEYRNKIPEEVALKEYPKFQSLTEYSYRSTTSNAQLTSDLTALFETYQKKTPDWKDEKDLLMEEGLEQFITTVCGLTPTNRVHSILLAYVLQTETLGDITKTEFIEGFKAYRLSTPVKIKEFFKEALTNLTTHSIWFKDLYMAAYQYANGSNKRPTIVLQRALIFWDYFLPHFGTFKTYPDWKLWITKSVEYAIDNGISYPWLLKPAPGAKDPEIRHDLWGNFYDFVFTMQDDYEHKYNLTGDDGWNSALDQFVLDFLDLEEVSVQP